MVNLDKLGEWPSDKIVRILLVLSLVIFFIVYPLMSLCFTLSGVPSGEVAASELYFSGALLKQLYALISNLDFYRLGQIFDYGFMVSYGLLIFSLALIIGRAFEDDSIFRKSGYVIAITGIIAPCCDVGENALILITLVDPVNFPDILAVIHSWFALFKWLLILIAILWAIVAGIVLLIKKLKN